jgi:hypothetical protein
MSSPHPPRLDLLNQRSCNRRKYWGEKNWRLKRIKNCDFDNNLGLKVRPKYFQMF